MNQMMFIRSMTRSPLAKSVTSNSSRSPSPHSFQHSQSHPPHAFNTKAWKTSYIERSTFPSSRSSNITKSPNTTTTSTTSNTTTQPTRNTTTSLQTPTEAPLYISPLSTHYTKFKSTITSTKRYQSLSTHFIKSTNTLSQSLHTSLLQSRSISLPRWISPRRVPFTISELLGHGSFVLVAASYATDDFLVLRCMAVAGSGCMLFFTYFHPHGRVLWLPFKWNALFIAINLYRITSILYYKYVATKLSPELKAVKHDHFDLMEWEDFAKLVSLATEETFLDGDLLVYQGQKNRYVRLVIEGELDVFRDGVKTYSLFEGNFVSEAGLHAGLMLSGTINSCCSIYAQHKPYQGDITSIDDTNETGDDDDEVQEPTKPTRARTLRWDRTELVQILKKETPLYRTLKASLSWDIIRKLKDQRVSLAQHKVSDPEFWTLKRTEQSEERYAAILANILEIPGELSRRRIELDKYRIMHHIDDDHHIMALKKCGWTPEEFKVGRKNDENNFEVPAML